MDASASKTSDSVIIPTALWIILISTSSVLSLINVSERTSTEPSTSALIITGNVLIIPSLIIDDIPSREKEIFLCSISRLTLCRSEETLFKSFSLFTTAKISATCGTCPNPWIWTASDGPASLIFWPLSFTMARTLPEKSLHINGSLNFRVPFWISMVPIGPSPLSNRESTTVPIALQSLFAFKSITSVSNNRLSNKSLIPSPVFALISTDCTFPPQFSTSTSFSDKALLTLSGSAPGLSILLIATIIGTLAALAWLIASIVCGITASSAATTRMTISVTCAPRARMAVNASCPGVSRNVTCFSSSSSTLYAPMCCVILPDSPATTLEFRI